MFICYVAGPYRGDIAKNVAAAREVQTALLNSGLAVICPHTMNSGLEACTLTDEEHIERLLEIVERVDALVVLPGWEDSEGTMAEIARAQEFAIPVYYWKDCPKPGDDLERWIRDC